MGVGNPAYEEARKVYLSAIGKDLTKEDFDDHDSLLNNQKILLLGEDLQSSIFEPHRKIIQAHSGRLVSHEMKPKLVIVGMMVEISESLQNYLKSADCYEVRIVTLQDFNSFLNNGIMPMHFENEKRDENFVSLSLLAKYGFKWPKVNLNIKSTDRSNYEFQELRTISRLKKEFKYSADIKSNKYERQNILSMAVEDEDHGLRKVAYFLQFLVNLNHKNESKLNAVSRWIEDMEWLKINYYDKFLKLDFPFLNPNYEFSLAQSMLDFLSQGKGKDFFRVTRLLKDSDELGSLVNELLE